MFSSKKKGSYSSLSMEKKMMLKIQNENLLPKGGGSDQTSLNIGYFFTSSSLNNRTWIPYGRLISEIFNQRGLSETRGFTDDMLGTVTSKIIN